MKKVAAEVRVVHKVAQEATERKKAVEIAATAQTAEAVIVQLEEGQATSSGQEAKDTVIVEGSIDPGTTSTQLKCPHITERSGPRKKVKALKLAIDLITLTEGDLHDISEMVRNVTSEVLQEFMMEHQSVLGALRA